MNEPSQTRIAAQMAEENIYSDIPEINQRIINILPKLLNDGILLDDAKPIPYGSRLSLRINDSTAGVTFYFSKKKGHSTVFDKKIPSGLVQRLRPLLEPGGRADRISPMKQEQSFDSWIGCDEGGKGAFAGPLVAVAFLAHQSMVDDLVALGVADSKTLTGKKLTTLGAELLRRYNRQVGITILYPETYNRLYSQFKSQGKSLNHLLAWAHGKAVEKLMPQKPDAIVVDQFAYPGVIRPRMPKGPELILRTKAENNIGVAAASVIAGAQYLRGLDSLSRQISVTLQPGAGTAADKAAADAVVKHGPGVLNTIVKIHFKNSEKVQQRLANLKR